MNLEFDMLGVAKKLVKFVFTCTREEIKLKIISILTECSNNKQLVFSLNEF
jgi:hypothetical protein